MGISKECTQELVDADGSAGLLNIQGTRRDGSCGFRDVTDECNHQPRDVGREIPSCEKRERGWGVQDGESRRQETTHAKK